MRFSWRTSLLPAPAWNRTEVDYPRDKLIWQAFEEQATRTPNAVALIAGSRQWSYRELQAKAESLQSGCVERACDLKTLVGIGIERSHALVIALLGTLKARRLCTD